ncbi:aldo/keto reductase [Flavisolibacter nicotianae]|uniref:aldo/keto reductase n=1 Tax=Flavisolibacter nicotianae TaxID=2364882 RepID=UPI000EB2B3F0|nr:aldo/keto reductase [Flavisolibacter nicotianae]
MDYALLGKSDLRISRIAMGCMSLGTERESNKKIIHRAIEGGINYFDTADLYDKGLNETSVGAALKGNRKEVIIATKAGNQWRADGSGWDWNPSKDYILTCAENSLRRLQTDYIDLYQLHGGTLDDPIDETIEAFEMLKQQGKIRWYGISSIRPNVIREYVNRSNIVSVMMQYSLLDRRPEETCLDLLQQNNIGVLARGSVASGLLVDKAAKPYLNYSAADVERAAAAVRSISSDRRTPAQTAIQYVLNHPAITAVVVGMRTREQLEEALQVVKVKGLTVEEMNRLRNSVSGNRYEQHR